MFTPASGHQNEGAVIVDLDMAQMVAGLNIAAHLPPGAVLTGGFFQVRTAYSADATATLGDAGSGSRYASGINLQTVGVTALTVTGYEVTAANSGLGITPSAVDATDPSGAATLYARYVVKGREHFSVG